MRLRMRSNIVTKAPLHFLLCVFAVSASAIAENAAPPEIVMCVPGELMFSEDFDPETVSERWGFKANFALHDGALLRTTVNPTESKRVFMKDPSFHNTIIQLDFKLSRKTTDLRLVTGSGGGYNSITQIRRGHFLSLHGKPVSARDVKPGAEGLGASGCERITRPL